MSCLLGGLTLFAACNDDDENGGGAPLQLGESGIVTMTLPYEMADTLLQLPVVNRPMTAATVEMVQFTQEELDAYNNRWQTDYLMIPEGAYEMLSNTISFASGERQKYFELTVHPNVLFENLLTQPAGDAKNYVLPLKLSGNDNNTTEVLYVMELEYPEMSFKAAEITEPMLTQMVTDIQITAGMREESVEVPNGQPVTFRLVPPTDKEAWVANYNTAHSTTYSLLPDAYYTTSTMTGAADASEVTGTVTIDRAGDGQATLERGQYILPLVAQRMEDSHYMLAYDTCAVIIDNPSHLFTSTDKVDRAGWKVIFCNSDNGVWERDGFVGFVIDGDPNTFWAAWYRHWDGQDDWWNDNGRGDDRCDYNREYINFKISGWGSWSEYQNNQNLLADDYIFIAGERNYPTVVIDMGQEYYISEVGFCHRTGSTGNGSGIQWAHTKQADVYVSNDPEFVLTTVRDDGTIENYSNVDENNWVHLCTINAEKTTAEFWSPAEIDDARGTGASKGRFLKFVCRDVFPEDDGNLCHGGAGEIWIKSVATMDGEPVESE